MNDKEKLESHKRMYSWIQEQAKKNRCFDEDYEKNDWESLENVYPGLLTLVETLISDLEKQVNKNQKEMWMTFENRLPVITISNEVPD